MSGYLYRTKCPYLDWSANMLRHTYIYIESAMNASHAWIFVYSVGVRTDST